MKEKNIRELAKRMGLVTVEDMCQYTIAQLVVKIANKVNELVGEVWRFETDVQEILKTQNENIQYLLGEGLHLEVENIFDGWVQDGTFDTLLNQSELKKVNDRIDETNAQLSQKANINDLANISNGTPLFANNESEMTDLNKNYVNLSDGFLYTQVNGIFKKTDVLYQSMGIGDKTVTTKKTDFVLGTYEENNIISQKENLYDKADLIHGVEVKPASSDRLNNPVPVAGDSVVVAVSNIIKIKKNTIYTYEDSFRWDRGRILDLWYDEGSTNANGEDISYTYAEYISVTEDKNGNLTFTSPISNDRVTGFVTRIQFTDDKINLKDSFRFVEGNLIETVEMKEVLLESKIPSLIVDECNLSEELLEKMNKDTSENPEVSQSWYRNKKIATYGDSLTAMYYWQPFVKKYFNTGEIINCGIGGSTVTNVGGRSDYMSSDERINSIPSDVDVILFCGGRNDWSYNLNIGKMAKDRESLDNTTFYGAYQMTLAKLIKKFPNALILCWNIPNGSIWDDQGEVDVPPVNWGRTIRDLCRIEEEICGEYGIPMIDVNGTAGFSFVNSKSFLEDGVHFNSTTGAKAVATAIINGMKRFEPITF